MIEKINSKFGIINSSDIRQLMAVSSLIEEGPILEIGTWLGKSAYVIACSKKENVIIHCVDPFMSDFDNTYLYPKALLTKYYLDYCSNLDFEYIKHLENMIVENSGDNLPAVKFQLKEYLDSIVFHRCKSQNFSLDFSPQFAFIDGGHSYEECYSDLKKVIVYEECLILVHDYDIPDVREACHMIIKEYKRYFVKCNKNMFYILDKEMKYKDKVLGIVSKEKKIKELEYEQSMIRILMEKKVKDETYYIR